MKYEHSNQIEKDLKRFHFKEDKEFIEKLKMF